MRIYRDEYYIENTNYTNHSNLISSIRVIRVVRGCFVEIGLLFFDYFQDLYPVVKITGPDKTDRILIGGNK